MITGGVDLPIGSTISVIEHDRLLPGRVVGKRDGLRALRLEGAMSGPFLATAGDYVTEAACIEMHGDAVTVVLRRDGDRYQIRTAHSLHVGSPLIHDDQLVGIVLSDISAASHESMRSLWQQRDVLSAIRSEDGPKRPLVMAGSLKGYYSAQARADGVSVDISDWDPEVSDLLRDLGDDHRYLRVHDRSLIGARDQPRFTPLRTWMSFDDLQTMPGWSELPGVFRVLRTSPARVERAMFELRQRDAAGVEMPSNDWSRESIESVRRFGRLKAIAYGVRRPEEVEGLIDLGVDVIIGADAIDIDLAIDSREQA